jgi:hypothetical protein
MGEAVSGERRAVVDELTRALGDEVAPGSRAWWQYVSVVSELGAEGARQLVEEVRAVEAAGGMPTKDGSRRRTPGGVFFALAYERLGPKRTKVVRSRADRRFQEEMVQKFVQLLALVLPADPNRAALPADAPAAAAPAAPPPPKPAAKPAAPPREVMVVRRRPAADPPAKSGTPTRRAGR